MNISSLAHAFHSGNHFFQTRLKATLEDLQYLQGSNRHHYSEKIENSFESANRWIEQNCLSATNQSTILLRAPVEIVAGIAMSVPKLPLMSVGMLLDFVYNAGNDYRASYSEDSSHLKALTHLILGAGQTFCLDNLQMMFGVPLQMLEGIEALSQLVSHPESLHFFRSTQSCLMFGLSVYAFAGGVKSILKLREPENIQFIKNKVQEYKQHFDVKMEQFQENLQNFSSPWEPAFAGVSFRQKRSSIPSLTSSLFRLEDELHDVMLGFYRAKNTPVSVQGLSRKTNENLLISLRTHLIRECPSSVSPILENLFREYHPYAPHPIQTLSAPRNLIRKAHNVAGNFYGKYDYKFFTTVAEAFDLDPHMLSAIHLRSNTKIPCPLFSFAFNLKASYFIRCRAYGNILRGIFDRLNKEKMNFIDVKDIQIDSITKALYNPSAHPRAEVKFNFLGDDYQIFVTY